MNCFRLATLKVVVIRFKSSQRLLPDGIYKRGEREIKKRWREPSSLNFVFNCYLTISLAIATNLLAEKSNLAITALAGAEAPNVSIPMW